jgi:hypothetical protein
MFPVRPTQRALFTWVDHATDEDNAPIDCHELETGRDDRW